MTATLPRMTEREFMEQVTQLAELRGWSWAHFRPAQTAKGWRTPVSGPLGKGWPDLVLVRSGVGTRVGQVLFVELKRAGAEPTTDQQAVLDTLADVCDFVNDQVRSPVEVYVWTPLEWSGIEAALR